MQQAQAQYVADLINQERYNHMHLCYRNDFYL